MTLVRLVQVVYAGLPRQGQMDWQLKSRTSFREHWITWSVLVAMVGVTAFCRIAILLLSPFL